MKRRRVLAVAGSLVALSGCTSDASTRRSEDDAETTDECGPYQLCEGSEMLRVFVSPAFSGAVVLDAGCRDEEFEIRPGEGKTLRREADAETCDVTLYVDGQEAYSDTIQDYESTVLRVESSGEVDEETVEV
ncbi:hypothetical protein GJR96_09170 [Haloferax sp. MBLA0076]|uniref:Lipoprotein n=1 Tax=Haloferax litoreum TaxID=2666140 RepID=A0A6A8GG39_9EURY|nr:MULTISPECIES: hypothetical protein [Haloferax]KAB1193607.1 hypothetical protein Hfx1148_09155 [Haloferax sp. CBA1148]MRX22125.1 hypothetical protein [Haloferax litoreum]